MAQYWLKPLGTLESRNLLDDDWVSECGFDDYELTTGPATPRQRPKWVVATEYYSTQSANRACSPRAKSSATTHKNQAA